MQSIISYAWDLLWLAFWGGILFQLYRFVEVLIKTLVVQFVSPAKDEEEPRRR